MDLRHPGSFRPRWSPRTPNVPPPGPPAPGPFSPSPGQRPPAPPSPYQQFSAGPPAGSHTFSPSGFSPYQYGQFRAGFPPENYFQPAFSPTPPFFPPPLQFSPRFSTPSCRRFRGTPKHYGGRPGPMSARGYKSNRRNSPRHSFGDDPYYDRTMFEDPWKDLLPLRGESSGSEKCELVLEPVGDKQLTEGSLSESSIVDSSAPDPTVSDMSASESTCCTEKEILVENDDSNVAAKVDSQNNT